MHFCRYNAGFCSWASQARRWRCILYDTILITDGKVLELHRVECIFTGIAGIRHALLYEHKLILLKRLQSRQCISYVERTPAPWVLVGCREGGREGGGLHDSSQAKSGANTGRVSVLIPAYILHTTYYIHTTYIYIEQLHSICRIRDCPWIMDEGNDV